VSRSAPTEKALNLWSRYITDYYSTELSALIDSNRDSEDCLALNVSLSALQRNNSEMYDQVVTNPVKELEIGEFVLQKMVEEEGGMFEVNLRFDDLPFESYKKPSEMCSRDIGYLYWFDAVPASIDNLKPWFKKAAWQCEKCSRITLIEVERDGYSSAKPPEICEKTERGCGRITKEHWKFGFDDADRKKLTDFKLTPYYGTLLDIRSLELRDASTLSPKFKNSGQSPLSIDAVAVGAIARELNTNSPKRITGKLGVNGSDFEFEIIGCSEIPIERMNEILGVGADESEDGLGHLFG